jgi:hypothetical protein
MRRLDPQHGPRSSALPGGFVAVLLVVLLSPALPASADEVPRGHERQSASSVHDAPTAAPEQALNRVSAPAGGAVRVVHPGGVLPVPVPTPAARCDGRPADLSAPAAPAPGIPLRVLFCTWLN